MNNNSIIVTDSKGVEHPIIAIKPYSSHPGDSHLAIVIRMTSSINNPFVVHTFNWYYGGFSDGAYCPDLNVALAVFNRR